MKIRLFSTKQAQLLKRSLDAYSRQHEAIAKNVANIDNPNFKPINTDFSQVLKSVNRSTMKATRDRHIGSSHFSRIADRGSSGRRSGKIDMTREMAKLAVNQIKYDFAARMLARLYRGLSNSIAGRSR